MMAEEARSFGAGHGRVHRAGYALGFGLGGFFDGILLHQILQWHHLLSGLETARGDLRFLVMTDGLFHLLMYVIAGFGLFWLWRDRRGLALPGADRRLFAAVLIGFGAWHLVDAVLSHWVLGLHRIRMDTANPLVWDMLWLLAFGLLPLAAGMATGRRPGAGPSALPLLLAAVVTSAGALSAVPPGGTGEPVILLFRPGMAPGQAMAVLAAHDGRMLWSDGGGTLVAAVFPGETPALSLYGDGVWLIGNSFLPAGCIGWLRA